MAEENENSALIIRHAVISDQKNVLIVKKGDVFFKKFAVKSISRNGALIEDMETGQSQMITLNETDAKGKLEIVQ